MILERVGSGEVFLDCAGGQVTTLDQRVAAERAAMNEDERTADRPDESDWPPRTDWLALAEPPELKNRDQNYQEQLRSIEQERNRTPEPSPSRRPGFWRRLTSSNCLSCGHYGGMELVPAWRDGWDTYRCRYCLTWTQKMPPPPQVGWGGW